MTKKKFKGEKTQNKSKEKKSEQKKELPTFKCRICGILTTTEDEMKKHVKTHNFSWTHFIGGLVIAYVIWYLIGLSSSAAFIFLALAVYSFVCIWYLVDAFIKKDGVNEGFFLGMLGWLLGFIVEKIASYSMNNLKLSQLQAVSISTIWNFAIIAIIWIIIARLSPSTVNMGSIYNYSETTQQALCQNNTAYIQGLLYQHGITNYTVISTYCINSEAYMVERHS